MQIKDVLVEAGGEPVYYFAYGMLTDPEIMKNAKFVGAAQLDNYRFTFRKFANVEESGGDTTDGVLWELPTDMIRDLDRVEGYPNMYGRKTVPVYTNNGQRYEAWVYYMTPQTIQWTEEDRMPTNQYIRTILNGYRHAGITPQQVSDAYYEIFNNNQSGQSR